MGKNEVLIFNGPNFVGKQTFYCRELRRTHQVLQPARMFAKDPSLGFRDICLQLIQILKEEQKIVIVDSNEYKKTRLSYVKLLQKKCENMSVEVVSILPQYGCEQLFWTRELRLASESVLTKNKDSCRSDIPLNDGELNKWFSKDNDMEIQYRQGIVEKPSESEGCTVTEKHMGIYTKSVYKFEVPVIFVQWEVICGLVVDSYKMFKLSKALQLWVDINQCGRIIVVCDGSQIFTGEQTKAQQQANIDKAVGNLINQFTSCPVYVYHIVDPKQAGCYVVPPKPGILAFLQQRHCLNLHSRRSVYMYETSCHMKVAETAGVRHIKASRVIDHPSLILSGHSAVTPSIPEMLKTKKILPSQSSPRQPAIPLVQFMDTFSEKKIHQNLPHGRAEYVYSSNLENIQRYNDLYIKSATKVGTPGSKMSPRKKCHSTPDKSTLVSHTSSDQSNLNISSRGLPKWMIKKDRSKDSRSSENNSQSESGLQTETKIRKTMYVMTEKELVEVACDILKQGGKNEIVERFLSSSDFGIESNSSKSTMKRKKSDTRTKTSDCWKPKMEKEDTLDDIGDQLGSLCPKMKVESDLEVGESNASVDIDTDMLKGEIHTTRNRDKSNIDKTVSSVLDDFSTSDVPSKPSPRKKTRIKNEPEFSSNRTPYEDRHIEISKHYPSGRFKNKHNFGYHGDNHADNSDSEALSTKTFTKKRKMRQSPDLSHLDDIF